MSTDYLYMKSKQFIHCVNWYGSIFSDTKRNHVESTLYIWHLLFIMLWKWVVKETEIRACLSLVLQTKKILCLCYIWGGLDHWQVVFLSGFASFCARQQQLKDTMHPNPLGMLLGRKHWLNQTYLKGWCQINSSRNNWIIQHFFSRSSLDFYKTSRS